MGCPLKVLKNLDIRTAHATALTSKNNFFQIHFNLLCYGSYINFFFHFSTKIVQPVPLCGCDLSSKRRGKRVNRLSLSQSRDTKSCTDKVKVHGIRLSYLHFLVDPSADVYFTLQTYTIFFKIPKEIQCFFRLS